MSAMLGGVVTRELRIQRAAPAFELLVEDRLDACYRLAAVLLGDRGEAEEATHEAVLRAQRAWPGLRDPAAAAAWLDRIVVNECRDRLRRRRVARVVIAPEAPVGELAATLEAPPVGELDALRAALGTLTPDHRVAVVLRYFLDLPVEAIAMRTGAPIGTVKSRLHHALAQLRAAYDAAARLDTER